MDRSQRKVDIKYRDSLSNKKKNRRESQPNVRPIKK
jgi:hypothetical protein